MHKLPSEELLVAYVDGELAVEDVTPEGRAKVRSFLVSLRWVTFGGAGLTVLLALLVMLLLGWF